MVSMPYLVPPSLELRNSACDVAGRVPLGQLPGPVTSLNALTTSRGGERGRAKGSGAERALRGAGGNSGVIVGVAGFRAACLEAVSAGQWSLIGVDPPLPHRGVSLSIRGRQDMASDAEDARAVVLRVPLPPRVLIWFPGTRV